MVCGVTFLFRTYFLDGCPIPNETILLIIFAVILGIFLLLIIIRMCCSDEPVSWPHYYSAVAERTVPIDPAHRAAYNFEPYDYLYTKEVREKMGLPPIH